MSNNLSPPPKLVHSIRRPQSGVTVSIFKKIAPSGGYFYSWAISKSYTQDEGKTWKYSHFFGDTDALLASKLIMEAEEWIGMDKGDAKELGNQAGIQAAAAIHDFPQE